MDTTLFGVKSVSPGITLITGTMVIDGASAVTGSGAQWTASKPAGTGVYRVTLSGKVNSVLDAHATVLKSGGSTYKVEVKAKSTSGSSPYVEFVFSSATSGTITNGAITVTNGAITLTPTTGTEYAANLLAGGIYPHNSAAVAGITAADATDLATSKTLAKAIADYLAAHDDDAVMHNAADTGNLACAAYASTPAEPADLAEVNAMYLEMSGDWAAHAARVPAIHDGLDLWAPLQLLPAPGAADQPANNRALNALKAAINMSCLSGGVPTTAYVKSTAVSQAATTASQAATTIAGTASAVDPVSISVPFMIVVGNSDQSAT